ncbi:MAG: lysylphosphatidylglycerol synthase transmembrane domain-containing protein [Candidatus Diapherotrites archaeon]
MNPYLKKSLFSLFLVFALLAALLGLTKAYSALAEINLYFLILACIFFIISVLIWLISWAYLIKKHAKIPYKNLVLAGFASFYGSITPVQLGADALRSIMLKDSFGVRYSQSISASMVVKGAKFLILAVAGVLVLLPFIFMPAEGIFSAALLSGFLVVLLASFIFLAPLSRQLGGKVAEIFRRLARVLPFLKALADFFDGYSSYLQKKGKRDLAVVLALSFLSWVFEFLALWFSFLSLGVNLEPHSLLIFMALVAVLERTPFLPRGIGVVEFVGYQFLAFPELAAGSPMSVAQIGAVLIVYDVVRLIVPTLLSICVNILLPKKPLNKRS